MGSLIGLGVKLELGSHQNGGALVHKWDFTWGLEKLYCKHKSELDIK